MGGRGRESRRRIDAVAKGTFLATVRRGAPLAAAARAAGVSLPGLYGARRRDPVFEAGWKEAMAASAGTYRIVANSKRPLQLRKMRNVRFDEARQQTFLDHFAGTADTVAAAAAAGVDKSTVYKHLKGDPGFAQEYRDALSLGYVALETEAVRQRLEAQARLQDGLMPTGEIPAEFERVMKLLARWERKDGSVGARRIGHGRQKSWTFDQAIEALAGKLKALGYQPEPELPDGSEGGDP
jgi:hypothetical protein